MEPGGTAPDGEVLDGVVIAKAMGDDGGIELVFTKLDFLFVQPDVKTGSVFSKFTTSKLSISTSGRMALRRSSAFMLQSYSICLRVSIANRDYPLIHKKATDLQRLRYSWF